jgi:hypothetical protein
MMIIALKIEFPRATNFNLEVFLNQKKNGKQNSLLAPALAFPAKNRLIWLFLFMIRDLNGV